MKFQGLSRLAEFWKGAQVSFCMESGSLRPVGPSGPTETWEPGLACTKRGAKNDEVLVGGAQHQAGQGGRKEEGVTPG